MEKQRYIGAVCAIISEIFGMAYLITGFVSSSYNADMAVLTGTTLFQLLLVVLMLVGFFGNKTRLLFGSVLISMGL
jgi:hypothetical protein